MTTKNIDSAYVTLILMPEGGWILNINIRTRTWDGGLPEYWQWNSKGGFQQIDAKGWGLDPWGREATYVVAPSPVAPFIQKLIEERNWERVMFGCERKSPRTLEWLEKNLNMQAALPASPTIDAPTLEIPV